uniref:Endonuclease/exonuclease/phosphatase domain-containing protein n=1 Tax=Glossina palpalis gambiensis TaxID=67801 RepID=A0A1B0BSW0_9MUSC
MKNKKCSARSCTRDLIISATNYNSDDFIVSKDLNVENRAWRDMVDNPNRKVLHNWLMDKPLEVAPITNATPSYSKGASFLDRFFLSSQLMEKKLEYDLPTFSNHFLPKLILGIEPSVPTLWSPRILTSHENKKWDDFHNHMESACSRITPSANKNLVNNDFINVFNIILESMHDSHSNRIEIKDQKLPIIRQYQNIF